MSMLLLWSIIITILLIVGITYGSLIDPEVGYLSLLWLGLILIGIWGVLGTCINVSYKDEKIENVKVYKMINEVYATDGKIKAFFDDTFHYNTIDSATQWYLRKHFNMYHVETSKELIPDFDLK